MTRRTTPRGAARPLAARQRDRHQLTRLHHAEVLARAEAIATNAAAALMGDLDRDLALVSAVRLAERIVREIEVSAQEHILARAS